MQKRTVDNTSISPVGKWREKYCQNCGNHCHPFEERFQVCILADLLDILENIRTNQNGEKTNG